MMIAMQEIAAILMCVQYYNLLVATEYLTAPIMNSNSVK